MPGRQHRIVRGEDFRRIVRKGNRVGGAFCITHAVFRSSEQEPARFGFIVSKAVGNAVKRNLVRRRVQSIAQEHIFRGWSGVDVIVRVLPAAAGATYAELNDELTKACAKVAAKRESTGNQAQVDAAQ